MIESAKIARASAMPAPNSAAERAEATVHRYYRAIESGHYSQAWGLLDTALQSELGGYSAWRDGYETTVATEVFGVHAVEASGSSALVALKIESTDIDECGSTIAQSFAGTWSLASSGGPFLGTAFDVEKTGGRTPILDPASCGSRIDGFDQSDTSECDPNYTGCVPNTGSDVDCAEVGETVEVVGSDVDGLDADGDGLGCE